MLHRIDISSIFFFLLGPFLLGGTSGSLARAQSSAFPIPGPPAEGVIRVATFNVALNRQAAGELAAGLRAGEAQAAKVATIIQCVSPDILLVNELDYDSETPERFLKNYLQVAQPGAPQETDRSLRHVFSAEVNTGIPSGMDLNANGRSNDNDDAWGYGAFPGQYGMAVYSRFPLDQAGVRTFQHFRWSQMPGGLRPHRTDPDTGAATPYHSDEVWQQLRLSSKSHWDVPVLIGERRLHVLACHPTPPVFDGPEDRNGCRNHDEIRFWSDYAAGGSRSEYILDDRGGRGGLPADALFVVLGDLNADPFDGDGRSTGIRSLLEHERFAKFAAPTSVGGVEASRNSGQANREHRGDPAHDTGDFNDKSPGNLRIDYVLPSEGCEVVGSGIFWPASSESAVGHELVQASDHRLVWVDIRLH